ncbi:hypothetical protein [Azospirillum endophyticum]
MKNYAQIVASAADDVRQAIVYAALSPAPALKLGEALTDIDRLNFARDPVQTALKRLKRVLFPWMVENFRGSPTKTKAICIFDMFLGNGNEKDENYSRLMGRMNTVKQDSELAKSMSWFKRVSTSSGRKVDAGIFDDMYRLHMLGSSNDPTFLAAHQELFHQIMRTPPRTSLSSELSAAVREIRETCKAAGFPLRKLGLNDSFA